MGNDLAGVQVWPDAEMAIPITQAEVSECPITSSEVLPTRAETHIIYSNIQ